MTDTSRHLCRQSASGLRLRRDAKACHERTHHSLPLAVLMSSIDVSPVSCAPPGQQAARQTLLRQHSIHCRALTLQQRLTYLSSI